MDVAISRDSTGDVILTLPRGSIAGHDVDGLGTMLTTEECNLDPVVQVRNPGLGREGVLWLVGQGVKVIGIDAYTLDRPFASMVADYRRTGDGRHVWPAHFAGIEGEYCQVEKLANLDRLPRPHGFYVSCLPVKVKGASAGWCRAVALVPDE